MKPIFHLAFSVLLAALTPVATAATCALVPSGNATLEGVNRAEWLREGDYAKLEDSLDQSLRQAGKGGRTDLHTLRDIAELLQVSGRDVDAAREWADKRPQSFLAQLVAGIAISEQSTYARGERAAAQTSRSQVSEMERLNQAALPYLQKARALNPPSALPYAGLIQIAAQHGAGVAPEVQAANQADPKNLAARITATRYLAPRWGGSFEALDALVKEASGRLPADQWHYLKYNVVLEKASHFEVIEKKTVEAHALYKEAQDMCSNSTVARLGLGRTRP